MKMRFALSIFMLAGLFFQPPLSGDAHAAAGKAKEEVVVYNWSEYIPQDVLDQFTAETGIKVVYSTYETNDAMYAKIKLMQGQAYDLVCPSTYYLHLMIEEGLLTRFDHAKLPGLSALDPKLLSPSYDPGNDYSIPYMWGSFGLLINTKYVDREKAKTWKDLLRPEYKGKIIISDDMRDTFGMAMHASGYSANSVNPDEIKAGYEFLKALRPSVRVFDVTAVKQAFISEEVIIGTSWNGDALVARQEHDGLEYVYPEDGALLWLDSFAMPKGAKNIDNAHKFVNFLLRPEIAARCQAEFLYSTPNLQTLDLLSPELRADRTLVPTEQELRGTEFLLNVGAKTLAVYQGYWERMKSGR